jgi:hypothetical protein
LEQQFQLEHQVQTEQLLQVARITITLRLATAMLHIQEITIITITQQNILTVTATPLSQLNHFTLKVKQAITKVLTGIMAGIIIIHIMMDLMAAYTTGMDITGMHGGLTTPLATGLTCLRMATKNLMDTITGINQTAMLTITKDFIMVLLVVMMDTFMPTLANHHILIRM